MSDMKCPFCGKRLDAVVKNQNDWIYSCGNPSCEFFDDCDNYEKKHYLATPEFWQELIRTRKALDVAVDALETFSKIPQPIAEVTFDKLSKIHAELFAETNLDQQWAKFEEEEKEFEQALGGTEDEIFELADMVIVSAGVARFNYCLGLDYLHNAMIYLDKTEWSTEALWQAVEKKIEKLKKRVWVKDPDVGYKHTKGIED